MEKLTEAKIALDYINAEVSKAYGSSNSNPELYKAANEVRKYVQEKFNYMCQNWIDCNVLTEGSLDNFVKLEYQSQKI